MTRVPKSKVDQDTGEIIRFRSMEEQLLDENKRLKKHNATLLKENAYMRAQLKLPDEGPIWPRWINKDTVRKTGNPDWPYQGLNDYGNQMIKYIKANPDKYPAYFTSYGIDKTSPDRTPFNAGGLYLGDDGYCYKPRNDMDCYDRFDH